MIVERPKIMLAGGKMAVRSVAVDLELGLVVMM